MSRRTIKIDSNTAAYKRSSSVSPIKAGATQEPGMTQTPYKHEAPAEPVDLSRSEQPEAADTPGDLSSEIVKRLETVERQNIRMKLSLVAMVILVGYLAFGQIITDSVIVKQTLLESKELKLLDNEGNARMFLRMYSRVPVFQLMDAKGKPRMSLGLRFDDTPFLVLSDKTGRTRAALEMTKDDEPTLKMFDKDGAPTFNIN